MIDPQDISILKKILNWILRFRITGDGVTCKNSIDGCSIDIKWPADKPRSQSTEMFIANVQKDGGSDGTNSTRATWTYTITRQGVQIGTTVPQDKNRPVGSMIPGDLVPGSTTFGLCFWGSDSKVHLWDAGEVEDTDPCPGGA